VSSQQRSRRSSSDGPLQAETGRRDALNVVICGSQRSSSTPTSTKRFLGHYATVLAPVAALMFSAVALAYGGASIAPPSDVGPWRQLGPMVTSRPGKLAHFYRLAPLPTALGVVASSSSGKPIRLTWFSYCEEQSDDGMTTQNQAIVTRVHRIVAYPPVFGGATLCTVSVTVRVVGGRASVAIYDY
jgi:hypothetical protein